MSSTTPRIALPFLADAQAQKQVTLDAALLQLDALLFARFLDRDLSAPPASPAEGDCYLVKATATGVWLDHDGAIAFFADGAWKFYAPFAGLAAYVSDEAALIVFDGSAWVDYASILHLQNVPLLGVNATADSTNKLAVKSSAVLFDNIGNGVQAKLNKAAVADTASFLFQTGYSGRAEFGLTGDDDFHLKVSPDGAAWTESLVIDKTTGHIGLGTPTPDATLTLNQSGGITPIAVPTYTGIHMIGDATANRALMLEAYGVGPLFTARVAGGTIASPAAVTAGMGVFNFSGQAFDGATFSTAAALNFIADETWTTSAHGSHWALRAVPAGTTALADSFFGYGDGRWGATGARFDLSYARQTPSTGFAITIADICERLILDPAGTLAAGTITMPATPRDGQLCTIASVQAVTALTHAANTGQTLHGALTTIPANGFAQYLYSAAAATWYRTA
jgi:Protein of unknown function (DUF2793)